MDARRARRRIVGTVLGAALGYVVAANLFLATPLGPAVVNRRPDKAHVTWRRAWSLWPGSLFVRDLQIRGTQKRVSWFVAADRARGRVSLTALLARRFEASDVIASGLRVVVEHHDEAPEPPPRGRPSRHPWTIALPDVAVEELREVSILGLRLSGTGSAGGGFRIVTSSEEGPLTFELLPSKAAMGPAVATLGDAPIGSRVELDAAASMAPFHPKEFPGMLAFDRVSGGSLTIAAGIGSDALEEAEGTLGVELGRGRLDARLLLDGGRLQPGTRLLLEGGGARLSLGVTEERRLEAHATGEQVSLGSAGGAALACERLDARLASDETRLHRLLSTARTEGAAAADVSAALSADGLALAFGRGVATTIRAGRAEGRLDVTGLIDRRISIEGLRAHDVELGLDIVPGAPPLEPVTVELTDAVVALREVRIGDACIEGPAELAGTLAVRPGPTLDVARAIALLPRGRLWYLGEKATSEATLLAEIGTAGESSPAELTRSLSGRAVARTRVSSLGFLEPLFRRTPWLSIDGEGELDVDVRVAGGALLPGSRLDVIASRLEAGILDSDATGRGVVRGSVGDRVRLVTAFTDVAFRGARDPEAAPFVIGHHLAIEASSREARELGREVTDLQATLALHDAEIPDLRAYSTLLPEAAGVSIDGGSGRVSLDLAVDGKSRSGSGHVTLAADRVLVHARDLDIEGTLAMEAPVAVRDIEARTLDLDGLVLDLDPVAYRHAEDDEQPRIWRGRLTLDRASAVWARPMRMESEARLAMADVGPLLSLFSPKGKFLVWLAKTLKVQDVEARARIQLTGGELRVPDLEASGGKLRVKARLHLAKERRDGDLLVSYDDLSAGLELRGAERDWKILRPEGWYEESRLPE